MLSCALYVRKAPVYMIQGLISAGAEFSQVSGRDLGRGEEVRDGCMYLLRATYIQSVAIA